MTALMLLLYTGSMSQPRNRLDWLSLTTVLIIIWTAVWRLQATRWTDFLDLMNYTALLGLVVGAALGYSRFSSQKVAILGTGYSVMVILWRLTLTVRGDINFRESILQVVDRLGKAFNILLTGEPVYDTILFLFSMSFIYWLSALVSGYRLVRYRNPWLGILFVGITMMVTDLNSPFTPFRFRYAGLFVLAVVFLVVRVYFVQNRTHWDDENIPVDYETGSTLGRWALVSAIVLLVIAWYLPQFVNVINPDDKDQQRAAQTWSDLRDRFYHVVAGLRSQTAFVNDLSGNRLELGTGTKLGDETVFTVDSTIRQPRGFRYYWRARTFDTYNNGRWLSTIEDIGLVKPETWPLDTQRYSAQVRVVLKYNLTIPAVRSLFSPGQPVRVNRPARIIAEQAENEQFEVSALLAEPSLSAGETYELTAAVSAPTIRQLQQAGENYPQWILDRYLAVPDDMSERVIELAEKTTRIEKNPYDKVAAITNYLRNSIEYAEQITAPPEDGDVLEWFLFDYRRGYCNYYATAEVLMLRSLGIPARLAIGYAQGFINEEGLYTVRLKDSHAWPEVFFPAYGWVPFEPTVSQEPLELLSGDEALLPLPSLTENSGESRNDADEDPNLDEEVDLGEGEAGPTRFPLAGAIAAGGLAVSAGLGWYLWKHRFFARFSLPVVLVQYMDQRGTAAPNWVKEWADYSRLCPMEKIFRGIDALCSLLKLDIDPGATRKERTRRLMDEYPEAVPSLSVLLDEYHRDRYSPNQGNVKLALKSMIRTWWVIYRTKIKNLLGV